MNSFTTQLDESGVARVRELLDALGFEFGEAPHAHFRASGEGAHVTAYCSGKVLVQGKGAEQVRTYLEAMQLGPGPSNAGTASPDAPLGPDVPRIGSDECGKGDYFGPLVVAAVALTPEQARGLRDLGVRDSKRMRDAPARKLAAEIRRRVPFRVVSIGPERYNQMHARMRNVNRMLAWAHAKAIEELLAQRPGVTRVIVDRFAREAVLERAMGERGRKVDLVQMPRAEADTAVAAASIVARGEFLAALERISVDLGFDVPKGATTVVEAARRIVAERGAETLGRFAKTHFRTTQTVLGPG